MVVVVASADADRALRFLQDAGEVAYRIGSIELRASESAPTVIV
jgi:phosphoribosylaminoimidazole (AIR) synthetase